MNKAAEYRRHAGECRALAQGLSEGAQKTQLLDMAKAWEGLAADLERRAARAEERTVPHEGVRHRRN